MELLSLRRRANILAMGRRLSLLASLWAVAAGAAAASPALTHRVWLLGGVPDEGTLAALRAVGVDSLALPVGELAVAAGQCRLTLGVLPDLRALGGWVVSPVVWVSGRDGDKGDAETLIRELAPVVRMLAERAPVVLVARRYWEGLPRFAAAVAARLGTPVELALSVQELRQHIPAGGWPGVRPVAMAFGNPGALGFAASTLQDDRDALQALDAAGVPYRAAVAVVPRSSPAPGAAGASLAGAALPAVGIYRAVEEGDAVVLRLPISWGGKRLDAGQTIIVQVVDTARYHRDLGLVLRSVLNHLVGWDTVGLPPAAPALGMSREAFLAYLSGSLPYPVPEVSFRWASPSRLDVAIANPTPHESALATKGNYIELRLVGGEAFDVNLGELSGVEYGQTVAGEFRTTVAREASAVRLYFTYLPPGGRLSGASVGFFARPRSLSIRWVLRLGDGSSVAGGEQEIEPTRR
jgi:hypothetical protein